MNKWTVRASGPALVLAAGVAATAALATVFVPARATSGAQQPLRFAESSSVAATPSAPAPPTGTVATAGGASATLTPLQVQAIAEKSARGRAEEIDLIDPARRSYRVLLSRPDGAETKVVVDGRTGRVLSTVVEPQDSAEAQANAALRDSGDAQDSAVPRDRGEAQDSAVPRDRGQPHDLVEPQDPAEAGN